MATIPCAFVNEAPTTWAQCLTDTAFFGNPMLLGLVIMGAFAIMIYKANLPGYFALIIGTILSAALTMSGADIFFVPAVVGFVASMYFFAMVALGKMDMG